MPPIEKVNDHVSRTEIMRDFGEWGRRAAFAPRKKRPHVAAAPTTSMTMAIAGHVEITEVARSAGQLSARKNTEAARIGGNFTANNQLDANTGV